MRPRRKLLRWSMVVAILALGGGIAWWWLATTPKQLSKQHFVAVTMELFGTEQTTIRAEIHDPAAIQRLTQLLDSGSPTPEHKCAGTGSLRFKRRFGSEVVFITSPGHDANFYEYGNKGGLFHVERKKFLDAVEPFGVPSTRLINPP